MVTVVRNHSHTCHVYYHGYYSRVAFTSFKTSGLYGYYLRVASKYGEPKSGYTTKICSVTVLLKASFPYQQIKIQVRLAFA